MLILSYLVSRQKLSLYLIFEEYEFRVLRAPLSRHEVWFMLIMWVDYLYMYIYIVIKIMSILYNTCTTIHHFFLKEMWFRIIHISRNWIIIKVVKYVHVPMTLSLFIQNPSINREKTDWKKLHIPKFVKTPAKCLHAIFLHILSHNLQ